MDTYAKAWPRMYSLPEMACCRERQPAGPFALADCVTGREQAASWSLVGSGFLEKGAASSRTVRHKMNWALAPEVLCRRTPSAFISRIDAFRVPFASLVDRFA